ncbi:hypothetical protein M422DRAFT_56574 [Sphaerobolus stellatus SS14]|uniref:Uncharacterized protein n=1 Tax=Sphaerobolus stellatus (strain SS14) TaxID=990650 RepID=A0A0C9T5A1_SPHS4|nr:hypothetical protein M422DRAFT_56574 [Sphaerobolus stellatus SS14]
MTTGESSLSFKFSGTFVIFSGSFSVQLVGRSNFVNNSGMILPRLTCSIDGVQIQNLNPSPPTEDNLNVCAQEPGSLVDGEHFLVLNITASSVPFYFDRIEYLPSSSVSLSHATLKVSHTDPAINYSSTWETYDNFVNMTQTAGSEMSFSFIGKIGILYLYQGHLRFSPHIRKVCHLDWLLPPTLPQNKSEGMYFIDDEAPGTSFTIFSGDLNLSTKQFNQIFFKTGDLNPGPHVLKVEYQGSVQQMGLSLRWLWAAEYNFIYVIGICHSDFNPFAFKLKNGPL